MALASRAKRYLAAMGIEVWEQRQRQLDTVSVPQQGSECFAGADTAAERARPAMSVEPAPPATGATEVSPGADSRGGAPAVDATEVVRLDWEALARRVAGCTACELHRGRINTVFGVGDRSADWMIIGEAPGSEEDRQGEPFVGRAGRLLNAMLEAVGLSRNQVYIANTLKCRPPGNRDPRPEEMTCCHAYLARQIDLVRPRLILSVGRISAQSLLQTDQPVGRLRGRIHRLPDSQIPLVVTYHPAYLLRKPTEKRKAWADLKLARKALAAEPGGAG
jgi:uracil-DNA glycosylase